MTSQTTIYYLLHCPNYLDEKRTLLENLQSIGENIDDKNDFQISELLLFGVSSNNDASNTCILNATIQYIFATKTFNVPLTIPYFNTYVKVPPPTIVHTRFNDNWQFVSFFYYCYY